MSAPSPLRELWSIAWPTVLTMVSYTVMQFMDKLMMGQVGPLELAAQGNGGIWSFTPIAIGLGMLTVVNTWVSQHLGAGSPEKGPQYGWAGIWIALLIWAVVLLPLAAVLPAVFSRLGHEPRLVELETLYARALLAGGAILLASRALHHFFFGLHRPKVVTVSAIAANATNIVGNYVLIFGADGIPAWGLPGVPGVPALGVLGAALATVAGTMVELLIPLAVFLGRGLHRELGTRAAWRPRRGPLLGVIRLGWPAAVQWGNELACFSVLMTVLTARFGADHMTAGWIVLGYMNLSFMPAAGLGVAITSIVGKSIGAGDPDGAVLRARLGVRLTVFYMLACAAAFLVFREPMIAFFLGSETPPEQAARITAIGSRIMVCGVVFQVFDAFGLAYSGALRGAGDTVWPGVVTVTMSWLVLVGGGVAMVRLYPELESVGPWIACAAYIIVLGIAFAWRFESGRWRRIQLMAPGSGTETATEAVREPDAEADATADPGPAPA